MINLGSFINPRWRWATVVVLLGMLFLARLGFWQLDRLEWRRGLNAQKSAELAQLPLSLNGDLSDIDLTTMANRQADVTGRYDFSRQFIIESQIFNGQPGRYLLTPLLIELDDGQMAVLVNRGWIPVAEENIAQFDRPEGDIEVRGYLQTGETLSGDRQTEITAERILYRVDVEAMGRELPYDLLPLFLLPLPADSAAAAAELPYLVEPDLTFDEGSHLSYAIQWFSFAVLLGFIYIAYVVRHEKTRVSDPTL